MGSDPYRVGGLGTASLAAGTRQQEECHDRYARRRRGVGAPQPLVASHDIRKFDGRDCVCARQE
jgi:hypothetical protein